MIRVIQIIDSLQAGGAERVAVNYANGLSDLNIDSHICVTREEGALLKSLNSDVNYIFLNKKAISDFRAIFRLKKYIVQNKIDIIHAHSTSFFTAVIVKILYSKVKIVWHDHYGNSEFLDERPKAILKLSSKLFSYIFSVNTQLKEWSQDNLLCDSVIYLKNFPILKKSKSDNTVLNGIKDKRILCLANLREQKNHIRLLEAFEIVKNKYSDWTLHCVGKDFEDEYSKLFFSKLKELCLEKHVYFYNSKSDVLNIMQQSNIGVLVSKSEGLPLALLEYGLANLPVVSTNVGECGVLLSDDSYGILLENDDKLNVANSIIYFIENKDYLNSCGLKFNKKIVQEYSKEIILSNVIDIYQSLTEKKELNQQV